MLTGQILDGCVTAVLVPEKLIMEQVALISVLHVNVGTEIGATFLQEAVNRFQELFARSPYYGEGKEMNNLLVVMSHLYNFRVFVKYCKCQSVKDLLDSANYIKFCYKSV